MDNLILEIKKIYKNLERRYSILSTSEKKRIIIYFYATLSFFTISFFGLFAISPTLDTISNLQKQYEDSKYVKESLIKKKNALRSLDTQFLALKDELNIAYLAIPASSNIPYLTKQIQTLAQMNNLIIRKLDFGSVELYPVTTKPQDMYSFIFNLTLEGEERKTIAFISSIINFDRILTISSININKFSSDKVSLSISGRAYFNK